MLPRFGDSCYILDASKVNDSDVFSTPNTRNNDVFSFTLKENNDASVVLDNLSKCFGQSSSGRVMFKDKPIWWVLLIKVLGLGDKLSTIYKKKKTMFLVLNEYTRTCLMCREMLSRIKSNMLHKGTLNSKASF